MRLIGWLVETLLVGLFCFVELWFLEGASRVFLGGLVFVIVVIRMVLVNSVVYFVFNLWFCFRFLGCLWFVGLYYCFCFSWGCGCLC